MPIHLLVWAGGKAAALYVLVETWDRALAEGYAEVFGGRKPARVLDLQVVDDADVEERLDHGALLFSLHHRPVQIWRRGGPQAAQRVGQRLRTRVGCSS